VSELDANDRAAAIEKEIQAIRGNLDGLVSELDHRRHQLHPLRAFRNHPLAFVIAGVVVAAAVTAGVSIGRARRREQSSWRARGRRLGSALGRWVERRPVEVIVQKPGLGTKVLGAAATATAAMVARRLAAKLLEPRQARVSGQ